MATYSYVTLDNELSDHPNPAFRGTYPFGTSSSGLIVGWFLDSDRHIKDFSYNGNSYTTLPLPSWPQVPSTYVFDINNSGEIVGHYNDWNAVVHAFTVSNGDMKYVDHPLSVSNYYGTIYVGQGATFLDSINNRGQIVGYYYNDSGAHAFLHTGADYATGYTTIEDEALRSLPGYIGNFATGITDNGTIVGYQYDSAGSHGFIYDGSRYTIVDYGYDTYFYGVNNLDQIVGTSSLGNFIYSDGTFIPIEGLPGNITDIDDAGRILGYYSDRSGAIHGYLAAPSNLSPTAAPDTVVVQKGKAVSASAQKGVLSNDIDSDVNDVLHVTQVNGSDLSAGQSVRGTYGTLTIAADGSYIYVADKNIPSLAKLGSVQDHFTYTVADGHGGEAESTLNVTVQRDPITNTESTVSIIPLSADKAEGDNGTTDFTFLVTRLGDLSQNSKVNWTVVVNADPGARLCWPEVAKRHNYVQSE